MIHIKEEMDKFNKKMKSKDRLKENAKTAIYKALVDSGMIEDNSDKEIYIKTHDIKYKVNIDLKEV